MTKQRKKVYAIEYFMLYKLLEHPRYYVNTHGWENFRPDQVRSF